MINILFFAPICGICAILYACYKSILINKIPVHDKEMNFIANAIRNGAFTFIKREYKVILIFVFIISILLLILNLNLNEKQLLLQPITFILGAFGSAFAGFLGMNIATKANVRTTISAKKSIYSALLVAFNGGIVMGMNVAGIGLLGLSLLFSISYLICDSISTVLVILTGFSMGASLIALFARVGGGIFTKGADVGADLVGKIEVGIPEDDPRNPATIADNVGDNVGDVTGMGADLFESYIGALLACMVIGSTVLCNTFTKDENLIFVVLPMFISGIGILASIVGSFFIKYNTSQNPQKILNNCNNISVFLMIIFSSIGIYFLIPNTFQLLNSDNIYYKTGIYISIISGILTGVVIALSTEYYCSKNKKPVNDIVIASSSGHATNIISGISVGMHSTVIPILSIAISIIISSYFAGVYGISLAAVGMLSTIGMQLSIDAFGPIVDNAGGIAVMVKSESYLRERTDQLDAVGNTTAAIGKGFAIGSAALTAFALFTAYQTQISIFLNNNNSVSIDITKPHVVAGMFIGAMLPFFFSALTINAVGTAANAIIKESRTQLKDILKFNKKPNYEKCIDISTIAALKGMVKPGILVILVPIIGGLMDRTGLFLGGILAGATISGVVMAIFMANAGGAWDNAKKQIEEEKPIIKKNMGKGSSKHQASITGDTVGDPFKDTAGPSINILIKLMSIISLIIIPFISKFGFSLFENY